MTAAALTGQVGTDAVQVVAFEGNQLLLVSSRAFAPGYPLRVTLALDGSLLLELKSIGSRRRDDGTFEVRARVTTMPKAIRDKLERYFA